jgi:hypothetical protein
MMETVAKQQGAAQNRYDGFDRMPIARRWDRFSAVLSFG